MSAATGKRKHHKGIQAFSVLTINGRVRLRRVRWHCPQDGSEVPIDRLLDHVESTISLGIREMACLVNQNDSSFENTKEVLWCTAHIEVSKGTTRIYLGCDGVKVPLVTDDEKAKRRQRIREKRRRRGRKCKPLPRAKRGADNAYKEFKVGYFYDEQKEHRLVGVTAGNHEAAGRMLRRMANQVNLKQADEQVALIDGAPWIRNQIQYHGLTEHIGLDFWHLQDYAQKTRRVVYGEDSEEGRSWLGDLMHGFKHDGYDACWDYLSHWTKPLSGAKRKAAKALLQYAAERQDMIRYPEFRKNHWQIGSGPTKPNARRRPTV